MAVHAPLPVSSLSQVSAAVFQRSYKNRLPVVIKGALSQWDTLHRWDNHNYLAAALEG